MPRQRSEQRCRGLLLVARGQLLDHRVPRGPLHHRQQAVPQVWPHHGVDLPVADSAPRRHFLGSLADMPLAPQYTA